MNFWAGASRYTQSSTRLLRVTTLSFVAMLAGVLPGAAQNVGTVTGTVTQAETGTPIAGVTIRVVGGLQVATTRADGGYRLAERVRDVRVLYVSFLLAYHRFALPAARAAECASESGGFRSWIDVVYSKQDSLGLKSWASYAVEAGIADTARIQHCAMSRAEFVRIAAGQDFGSRIDLTGTPTVIANVAFSRYADKGDVGPSY